MRISRLNLMRFWSVLLAVLLVISNYATEAQQKGATTGRTKIPVEFAKEIFNDDRVKTVIKALSDLKVACAIPDPEATEGRLLTPAEAKSLFGLAGAPKCGGDYSSCYYEVDVNCPQGSVTLFRITCEYSPPAGSPLNLHVAVRFKE